MGNKCEPTVANMYLYILERKWIIQTQPILYKRFIDDIFTHLENKGQLESLLSCFKNLKIIKNYKILKSRVKKNFYFNILVWLSTKI